MTTAVYKHFVVERFKTFPTFPETFLHAAIGLLGELIELKQAHSRENLLEEIGDARFYWVAMETVLQSQGVVYAPPYGTVSLSLATGLDSTIDAGNALMDQAKKLWAYNRPLSQNILEDLSATHEMVGDALAALITLLGSTEGEVDTLNIVKLQKRYPKGYSDKDAEERKDKQ